MCRFNATASLPSLPGGQVPVDEFNDAFNWFDAIDAIDLEEEAACEPAVGFEGVVKGEETEGSGLDLVGWFQQQICTEWTTGTVAPQAGVESPASTEVAQPMLLPGNYVLGNVAVSLPASSGSVGEACEEDLQHSNNSSASPSIHKLNNAVEVNKPTRQSQYTCRQRVPRVNYSEVEDKIERVKQKRRESAQRSRARKNQYMHELETENAALRGQVAQLQQMVSQLQSMQYMNMGSVPASTGPSC